MSMVVAPGRSREQRFEALQRANEVRSYRAGVKEQMRRGAVCVDEVLCAPAPDLGSMKALDLLLAAPKVGRVKAQKLLAQAGMSPSKTLGGMSERQRRDLVALLRRSPALSVRR